MSISLASKRVFSLMSEDAACTHGEREGTRALAKILAAVLDYSEQAVRQTEEEESTVNVKR